MSCSIVTKEVSLGKAPKLSIPTTTLPANATCPELSAIKSLIWEDQVKLAQSLYPTKEEMEIFQFALHSMFLDSDPTPLEGKVGELLYYRRGHKLAAQKRYGELTTLQLVHEILARGICARERIAVKHRFQMIVMLTAYENELEREARAVAAAAAPGSTPDSGYESTGPMRTEPACNSGDDDDEGDVEITDDEDDEQVEKGPLVINHWMPALGRSVPMAF